MDCTNEGLVFRSIGFVPELQRSFIARPENTQTGYALAVERQDMIKESIPFQIFG